MTTIRSATTAAPSRPPAEPATTARQSEETTGGGDSFVRQLADGGGSLGRLLDASPFLKPVADLGRATVDGMAAEGERLAGTIDASQGREVANKQDSIEEWVGYFGRKREVGGQLAVDPYAARHAGSYEAVDFEKGGKAGHFLADVLHGVVSRPNDLRDLRSPRDVIDAHDRFTKVRMDEVRPGDVVVVTGSDVRPDGVYVVKTALHDSGPLDYLATYGVTEQGFTKDDNFHADVLANRAFLEPRETGHGPYLELPYAGEIHFLRPKR